MPEKEAPHSKMDLNNINSLIGLYQLTLPEKKVSNSFGDRLGKNHGSSIDFQDHRSYFPGDDLRHLDWSAYARTDQLIIKRFHEEISPQVDIVLDISLSMAQHPLKWERTIEMALFLVNLCKADFFQVKLWVLGASSRLFVQELQSHVLGLKVEDGEGLGLVLHRPLMLRKNSIRFILSDFMFSESVEAIVDQLCRSSAYVVGIQLLDEFELNPGVQGGLRLTDSESHDTLNLRLTNTICERYIERLQNHLTMISQKIVSSSGVLFTQKAQMSLSELLQELTKICQVISVR